MVPLQKRARDGAQPRLERRQAPAADATTEILMSTAKAVHASIASSRVPKPVCFPPDIVRAMTKGVGVRRGRPKGYDDDGATRCKRPRMAAWRSMYARIAMTMGHTTGCKPSSSVLVATMPLKGP